jgi:hypothetical protein
MTRRGSLVYYLTAEVCGSLFLAITYYPYFVIAHGAPRQQMGRDILFTFFFTAMLGAADLLITAFVLRMVARRAGWTAAWQWLVAGGMVLAVVTAALGGLGFLVEQGRSMMWLRTTVLFLLIGPRFVLQQPLWLPLPAGVATAYALYLVHRAFEPRADAPAAPPQTG